MAQKFVERGYKIVHLEEESDICIINTCTVTNIADKKSRQTIRHVKDLNPNAVIVATGCYAQVNRKELENLKEIDMVISNNEKSDIVSILENNLINRNIKPIEEEKEFSEFGTITYTEKTRAVIKVQDGCNNFCTYCIVPYTRGKQRSRKMSEIIKEVKELYELGYQEITLLGQNVNAYGKDLDSDYDFATLLKNVAEINIPRIRFVTSHPWDFTDEMIDVIAKYKNIMPYIHLPLQSGSSKILKMMGRRYTKEDYLTLYNKINTFWWR